MLCHAMLIWSFKVREDNIVFRYLMHFFINYSSKTYIQEINIWTRDDMWCVYRFVSSQMLTTVFHALEHKNDTSVS
jgi:hypothetical protein